MAIESHLTLRGFFESLPEGSRVIAPDELVNSDAPATVTNAQLQSGDNTVSIPSNAVGCLIIFDSASTAAKTLKGDAGDTGIIIHSTNWLVLSFDPARQSTFIINSDANDVDGVTVLYTEIVFF